MKRTNKTNKNVGIEFIFIQRGITIIALIITIIIMLILSGIVISFAIGENGIFKIAWISSKNYTNEQVKEETQMKDLLNYIEDNITTDTNNTELKSGLYCTNGTFISWNELVTKYGLNIEQDYTGGTYETEETSAYSVFSKNNFQGKLVIDKSVENIGVSAFRGCTGLSNVAIPNSVTSIQGGAFMNCINLTNVNIPDSVTYIGAYAFQNCSKLATLYIPSSVTTTGAGSIVYQCSPELKVYCGATSKPAGWYNRWNYYSENNVVSVYWNVTRQEYEEYLKTGYLISRDILRCVRKDVINAIVPNSVTSIEGNAFSQCKELTNISIPDSVTTIGAYAFRNCSKLSTLYIPSSVVNTGSGSLIYQCSSGLKIYCGATSKPAGWYNRWNYYSDSSAISAIWGVTREQYEKIIKNEAVYIKNT